MCDIPDDHMPVEDVIEVLEGLKASMELTAAKFIDCVDKAICELNGGELRAEPLRLLKPITEELEKKVQANIDRLGGR